ncbi:MAG: tRNA uridine(34) 5-carboxymethylaminomethyl modification radical SAM/GNAT enzyme Elp3 [Anaerolineales bacterium]|nr:tRNA uridine(34) 5-carboxymethylaminomethyl modification radical SAM/GNAT enzyme Elp3 [Anaerolineales bacterium]
MDREKSWFEARIYTADQLTQARAILADVRAGAAVDDAVRLHPDPAGGYIGKHILVAMYRQMVEQGELAEDTGLLRKIRMKPGRTLSGVTTVTVLTAPGSCPGECIFCPQEEAMPKSYLPDEPGAMRAVYHQFDPYDQTMARIEALQAIGHPTDKIELLVLGGTWSTYPNPYQEWFIKRCLDAMNGFDAGSLEEAQLANELAEHRNVGLVLETRPDSIDRDEVRRLRWLGATKIQMGAQSLDDHILVLNKRGHDVQATRIAVRMLRAAGFKIMLHWMPNLLGATLESDAADFLHLWSDEEIRPDELKIYPCQLLRNTELYEIWQQGGYTPYTMEELIDLIVSLKPSIPRYCRVNRIVRDIPSDNVVAGNKRTSLRQDIQRKLTEHGQACSCIRCREVRKAKVDPAALVFDELVYTAGGAEEHFMSVVTPGDQLAGYLRLSLPGEYSPDLQIEDLDGAALIREVHVYGQSLQVGAELEGAAQHIGLGTDLVAKAEKLARDRGYRKMAVISALGTRGYYRKLGYSNGALYMVKVLD